MKKSNNFGLTLLELVIAMAIASIIMIAILNLFLYNNRLYKKSEKLSDVQFDVRMASDLITSELRNVNNISLTDTALPNSINATDLSSKYKFVNSITFSISNEGAHYLLSFTIDGSDEKSENQYQIISKVLLNNITSAPSGTSSVIYYRK